MTENRFRQNPSPLKDAIAIAAVAAVAALVFFPLTASSLFPGESARLAVLWSGLDAQAYALHPLAAFFAKAAGGGNLLAPFCGVFAAAALAALVSFFLRERVDPDVPDASASSAGRLAGVAAALVFVSTPAVLSASTHLTLAVFSLAWALATLLPLLAYARLPAAWSWLVPAAMGLLAGPGAVDSAELCLLVPFALACVWFAASRRGLRPFGPAVLFLFTFAASALAAVLAGEAPLAEIVRAHRASLSAVFGARHALSVATFATIPFFVNLFATGRVFCGESSAAKWIFQIALTVVTLLAVASPLQPGLLLFEQGVSPVFASAFVAATAGTLIAFWTGECRREAPEADEPGARAPLPLARFAAYALGGAFALALAVSAALALVSFDRSRGAFADRLADRLVADLGERSWVVTDGTLDDHIRHAAKRAGKTVRLVCLARDTDERHLDELRAWAKEEKLGGDRHDDLLLALRLGVRAFVRAWFADASADAGRAVVFGHPDLWVGAGRVPVPETLFFGCDESVAVDTRAAWEEIRAFLDVPAGGESAAADPVEKLRRTLRRHFGFVANNRAVHLWERGREDEAFALFDLVLEDIDRDNVSALFNEYELACAGHPRAALKRRELERRLASLVADEKRRTRLWMLSTYYGYVRNPDLFIRQGYRWARSGRPGEALLHVMRAADLVPEANRPAYLRLLASLYAADGNAEKARETYGRVLEKAPADHDALVGLAELHLRAGERDKALACLTEALAAVGDDPRFETERVLADVLRDDLVSARARLRALTDADRTDARAWALLSSVAMREYDRAASAGERAKLLAEMKNEILPRLEKTASDPSDYRVQVLRSFVLLHQDADGRRAARDALAAAARTRPDKEETANLILELDISLNDAADAERQAVEMLRRNRRAPLANYVMGSIALRKGETAEAEAYLRRAVAVEKPTPFALNDLAETLRRRKAYPEALRLARRAVQAAPDLYVAWETLGTTLMESGGDAAEAEACVAKACELSGSAGGEADVRVMVALARIQILRGEKLRANGTLRKIAARASELTAYERAEFEELRKRVR